MRYLDNCLSIKMKIYRFKDEDGLSGKLSQSVLKALEVLRENRLINEEVFLCLLCLERRYSETVLS